MNLLLIGAGGAAHHAYTPIIQLVRRQVKTVTLFDGDTFEKKNISRQALALNGIGRNKAEVMAEYLKTQTAIHVNHEPRWFFKGCGYPKMTMEDVIICMADNHRARREARDVADEYKCWLVSCACENTSGEAWAYHRKNKGTQLDPFTRWPEMETDDGDDPIKAEGCASEAAFDLHPQTPYGNTLAAAMAVYLINNTVLNENKKAEDVCPVIAGFTGTTLHTLRGCDLDEEGDGYDDDNDDALAAHAAAGPIAF
jgi:molybdopterin/thiamine biosynthesis adenylyltransferase